MTRLPRDEFYKEFCAGYSVTDPSFRRAFRNFIEKRPDVTRKLIPGIAWFFGRTWRYNRVHKDYRSFLRDETGLWIADYVRLRFRARLPAAPK